MTEWTDINYAVVDVEGNGQQPPELVELAVVPVTDGNIDKPTSWLVRPPHPIRHFATSIHGIKTSDVADCPLIADIAPGVRHALDAPALVAHNAHVDVSVLERELEGWKPPEVFDTLRLAKRLLPGLPSYKLGVIAERFGLASGLPEELTPHRATYDALVTARLFVHLAARAGTLEELRGQPPERAEEDALF